MTGPAEDSVEHYWAEREPPSLAVRLTGHVGSRLIVAAPQLWPTVRWLVRRIWNRQAGRWNQGTKPYSLDHLAPMIAACNRLEAEPTTILDLGTGTGAGAMLLGRRFPEAQIVGVDIAKAMIEEARARRPDQVAERVAFVVADAASLPYGPGSFDLITLLNVPPFVEELVRVLRKGGHVIVADSFGPQTPSHIPSEALRRAFERRGIEVIAKGKAAAGLFLVGRRRIDAGRAPP